MREQSGHVAGRYIQRYRLWRPAAPMRGAAGQNLNQNLKRWDR